MQPDPPPNLELGLAAFLLLPVLFSPLFAETGRSCGIGRRASPKIKASYWLHEAADHRFVVTQNGPELAQPRSLVRFRSTTTGLPS